MCYRSKHLVLFRFSLKKIAILFLKYCRPVIEAVTIKKTKIIVSYIHTVPYDELIGNNKQQIATMVETEMSEPQVSSVRYGKLLKVLNTALLESRRKFNTEEAIKECYGDDASMFDDSGDGSGGQSVLASAIDAMVDQVNEKVRNGIVGYLEQEGIEKKLASVETIINRLDANDDEQKQADAADRQSARDALASVRLPKDVLPAELMRYQSYKLMENERNALLEEIAKVEEETKVVNERIASHEDVVNQGVRSMQAMGQQIQQSTKILESH